MKARYEDCHELPYFFSAVRLNYSRFKNVVVTNENRAVRAHL